MLLQQLTHLNPREFHNKYEVQVDGHEHGGLHRLLLTDKNSGIGVWGVGGGRGGGLNVSDSIRSACFL